VARSKIKLQLGDSIHLRLSKRNPLAAKLKEKKETKEEKCLTLKQEDFAHTQVMLG
jgi:hypothetical protein